MKRKGRKEVTWINLEGVAADGGFVFKAAVLKPNIGGKWTETSVKATSYADGIMEIAIDYTESISRVAEIISGMFSSKSNLSNLDAVILNYRNIRLQVRKSNGRKDIICMLMKAMSMPDYKKGDNDVSVDTETCQKCTPLKDSDKQRDMRYEIFTNSFHFDRIFEWGKGLYFKKPYTRDGVEISSIKDGIVTVECMVGSRIDDFVENLRKFFKPYSNLYGVKAVEVEFNQFAITMDEQNAGRILQLFHRSCDMSSGLWERELQEYYNSPEYVRDHAKSLKKDCRKKAVVQKVRDFQKNADFTIVDKKKQAEWENCKTINSKNDYSNEVIEYAILWAQYMEYLMAKHDKKVSDVWDMSSHLADIDGITGFMYGCAVGILSSVWKYGEELRVQHNSKYGHEGDGVVNPAILTISA